MAGHSKFANIKHKKERADSKRGKIFTKIGRELAVAVKQGGSNPETNSRLRDAIAKAKANNMPNDNIERSIKKAAGNLDTVNYESVTYEGYGPAGAAVIVEALTDNRHRTAANVRNAFTKGAGNLGQSGSVAFQFEKLGQIAVERTDKVDEEKLMELSLDLGAEDFISSEEGYEIVTSAEDFHQVQATLKEAGYALFASEITMMPSVNITLKSPEDIKKMNKLLDLLEEDDDVQEVYHNAVF